MRPVRYALGGRHASACNRHGRAEHDGTSPPQKACAVARNGRDPCLGNRRRTNATSKLQAGSSAAKVGGPARRYHSLMVKKPETSPLRRLNRGKLKGFCGFQDFFGVT